MSESEEWLDEPRGDVFKRAPYWWAYSGNPHELHHLWMDNWASTDLGFRADGSWGKMPGGERALALCGAEHPGCLNGWWSNEGRCPECILLAVRFSLYAKEQGLTFKDVARAAHTLACMGRGIAELLNVA